MSLSVAYQGIEGAYSSVAIADFLERLGFDHQRIGVPTFRLVATTVLSEKADLGLVPVDNAISGTVRDGYDLLAEYGLLPLAELEWKMDHRLLGLPGAELSGIREVLAHPLVLGECGRFLGTLAGARVIPAVDTGVAARDVAAGWRPGKAAIAPAEAAALYGLRELARSIADHPENYTRFLLFTAPPCSERVARLAASLTGPTQDLAAFRHAPPPRGAGRVPEHPGHRWHQSGQARVATETRQGVGVPFLRGLRGGRRANPGSSRPSSDLRAKTLNLQVIGSYSVGRGTTEARAGADATRGGPSPCPGRCPHLPKNYPKAARPARPQGTRVPLGSGTVLGGDEFVVIAGPCSVESRDQMLGTARAVVELGARALRGGAFKPRTNPYSFQGLGWEGVALLAEAGRSTGVPVVSEVMSVEQVERMAREVDVLQIGARNMQNFDLLRAVGRTRPPGLAQAWSVGQPRRAAWPRPSTSWPRATRT